VELSVNLWNQPKIEMKEPQVMPSSMTHLHAYRSYHYFSNYECYYKCGRKCSIL